jgi:hypothetical protein
MRNGKERDKGKMGKGRKRGKGEKRGNLKNDDIKTKG